MTGHRNAWRYWFIYFSLICTMVGCTNDRLKVSDDDLIPLSIECHVDDVPIGDDSIPLSISVRNVSLTEQYVASLDVNGHVSIDLYKDGVPVKPKTGHILRDFATIRADKDKLLNGKGSLIIDVGSHFPSYIRLGERANYVFDIKHNFDLTEPGRYLVVVHYWYTSGNMSLYIPGSATFAFGGRAPDPIKWHNP